MKLIQLILFFLLPLFAVAQHEYETTLDTITDTEQDTVVYGNLARKAHTASLQCRFTELSGASNITAYLEGSTVRAGDLWFPIASDTIPDAANTGTIYLVKPSTAQNFLRYRYRISGDSGATQSQQYFCAVATKEDE